MTLQNLEERFPWPKEELFFFFFFSDIVLYGCAAWAARKSRRMLTPNDYTTELINPGVPASSLHATWENKCPYCLGQLLHFSLPCTEGIILGGTISLFRSGREIGIDLDSRTLFIVLGFCIRYMQWRLSIKLPIEAQMLFWSESSPPLPSPLLTSPPPSSPLLPSPLCRQSFVYQVRDLEGSHTGFIWHGD